MPNEETIEEARKKEPEEGPPDHIHGVQKDDGRDDIEKNGEPGDIASEDLACKEIIGKDCEDPEHHGYESGGVHPIIEERVEKCDENGI